MQRSITRSAKKQNRSSLIQDIRNNEKSICEKINNRSTLYESPHGGQGQNQFTFTSNTSMQIGYLLTKDKRYFPPKEYVEDDDHGSSHNASKLSESTTIFSSSKISSTCNAPNKCGKDDIRCESLHEPDISINTHASSLVNRVANIKPHACKSEGCDSHDTHTDMVIRQCSPQAHENPQGLYCSKRNSLNNSRRSVDVQPVTNNSSDSQPESHKRLYEDERLNAQKPLIVRCNDESFCGHRKGSPTNSLAEAENDIRKVEEDDKYRTCMSQQSDYLHAPTSIQIPHTCTPKLFQSYDYNMHVDTGYADWNFAEFELQGLLQHRLLSTKQYHTNAIKSSVYI